MNNIKLMSLSAVLMAGVAGGAQATPAGTVVTKTADIIFAASGTASLSLTPAVGEIAGYFASKPMMTGTASSDVGKVAIRMTPGTFIQDGTTLTMDVGNSVSIPGKSNPNNRLAVQLANNITSSQGDFRRANPAKVTDEWFYSKTESNGVAKSFGLYSVSAQPLLPDTYVASVDAVTWAD